MAKVEWVKLYTDMFDNKKVTYIRTLPEGNNILLIWIMLLTMAGNCNNRGYIYITENVPYTPEILAKELDFEISTIKLAIQTFIKLNMIALEGENIYVCGWCEYQNIDGMDKIRLQTKERVARFREKKKQLMIEEDCNATCNVTVTESNAIEEDIRKKNKKKELDKEKDIYIDEIINYLNTSCKTSFKTSTKSTRQIISARLDDGYTVNQLKAIIDVKKKEWINSKEFSKYLRPSTLFTPKHAEDYLNQSMKEGVYKDGSGNSREESVTGQDKEGNEHSKNTFQYEDDITRALRGRKIDLTDDEEYGF